MGLKAEKIQNERLKMFKYLFVFLLFSTQLPAQEMKKRVDLVSYAIYLLPSDYLPIKYRYLKNKYELVATYDLYNYVRNFKADDPNLQKIIFFDYCEDLKTYKLPKKKLVCFKWEAVKIRPSFYDPYSVVYTFDDDLVDGKKFFKFYYPVLQQMLSKIPPFKEKKLCTMVAGNWISERVQMVDFFAKKPLGEFEFYGLAPSGYGQNPMYRGKIEGYYSSSQKLEVMKNYRFCICFENTHTTPGYITEKIFDTFAAGCVPIYWGPQNVEKYIPKSCFIDYRDFHNNEELYQYIKTMPQKTYDQYIENICHFLKSDQAQFFSVEYFEKLLYEAASR